MLARLFLLFIIVPLIELALLMILADATDWKVALALVLVTGAAGAWLVRHQGWRTLQRIRAELRAGRLPADALLDGLFILLAGGLLLTPGILTDLTGLALLFPPTRAWAKYRLVQWFQTRWIRAGNGAAAESATAPVTIDATARRV
ncbi:MAG: FxsA family protein [Pirellulales bacterium]